MKTIDFLRLVVPEQGAKFICALDGNGFRPLAAGYSHEDMAQKIETLSSLGGINIYHALGGFVDHQGRKADRATHFRAHWLDLDVAKETGESYTTQEFALEGLKAFILEGSLPKPTLILSSGMGVHVYWAYEEDMPADRWQAVADKLKEYVAASDLVADMVVISDKARVLRPAGTVWYDIKDRGFDPRPVDALWVNKKGPLPLDALEKALGAPVRESRAFDTSVNDSIMSEPKYDEGGNGSDPLEIARACAQMKRFKESGDLPYELWRLCLGVLKKCGPTGEKYAHEWSANNFAGYSHEEVENKLNSWNAAGATRCATFRKADPNGPCESCPVRCNSPFALGFGGGAKPVSFRNAEGEAEVFDPITFPDDARIHNDGTLQWRVKPRPTTNDPNPDPVWTHVSNMPFYVESIAVNENGTQESDIVCFPRRGQRKSFVLAHATAQNAQDLKKILNSNGVFVENHIEKFVVSYIDLLKEHVKDTPTHPQMGWVGGPEEFLIGDMLIEPEEIRQIRVNPFLKPKARLFDTSNDATKWVDAIDTLYNLPHGEPYQFVIAASLGSMLVPILDAEEYNGIPVALTSDESGYGKSTVCKIALAAYGRVERNLNVLTGDEVSSGAVEVQCSTFNCVPHLFDEMTNKSGQDTSHILYMLSNGVARARLKQDGTPRPASPPWRGISFITGNKNIFLKLTESRVNPEAAQMRVFEIPLENYGKVDSLLHSSDFITLTNSVRSGYGDVAVGFARFVMANREKVKKMLWKVVDNISNRAGVRHDKERFYIYTIACASVAAVIMHKLGYIRFNPEQVCSWAVQHMASLRDNASEFQRDTNEDFALMLGWMVGQGKVIATVFAERAANEFHLRGQPSMRIRADSRQAVISAKGFLEYCREVSKNPSKFRQELFDAGCLDSLETVPVVLGEGIVGLALGTSQCYRLNYDKAAGTIESASRSTDGNVVQIRR